jgi:bacterioferritin
VRGDPDVIEILNEQLTAELTAINQYFLHAKIQANRGWHHLAEHSRSESIDEMRHAERLTERILFLDGLPNYQRLGALRIGSTVGEMLQADLAVEQEAVVRLRSGVALFRDRGDITSARIFEETLADEEGHIDFLETELDLLATLGEHLYLLRATEPPSSS